MELTDHLKRRLTMSMNTAMDWSDNHDTIYDSNEGTTHGEVIRRCSMGDIQMILIDSGTTVSTDNQ